MTEKIVSKKNKIKNHFDKYSCEYVLGMTSVVYAGLCVYVAYGCVKLAGELASGRND